MSRQEKALECVPTARHLSVGSLGGFGYQHVSVPARLVLDDIPRSRAADLFVGIENESYGPVEFPAARAASSAARAITVPPFMS
jgi:hypothetical protein